MQEVVGIRQTVEYADEDGDVSVLGSPPDLRYGGGGVRGLALAAALTEESARTTSRRNGIITQFTIAAHLFVQAGRGGGASDMDRQGARTGVMQPKRPSICL